MKKILNALFVALLAVFTFSSCSDVPAPYEILEPGSGNQGGVQPTGEGTKENPYNVVAAQQNQNGSVAWVEGYIVGTILEPGSGNQGGVQPTGEGTKENPYNVVAAQQNQNGSVAWVEGYIVGTIENVYDEKGEFAGNKAEGTKENPYNVVAAQQNQNGSVAWVEGYIVGTIENVYDEKGEFAGNKANFSGPFEIKTNVMIAASADETNEKNCLPVKLKGGSDLSNALNLQDHPENLKGKLLIQGKLSKGFGKAALVETTAAVFNDKEVGEEQGGNLQDHPENLKGKLLIQGKLSKGFGKAALVETTAAVFNDKEVGEEQGGGTETPEDPKAIFQESFKDGQGQFTIDTKVKPAGSTNEHVWHHNPHTTGNTMRASAFINGKNEPSEDWLVSPEIDLANVKAPKLVFSHAINHDKTNARTQVMTLQVKEVSKEWAKVEIPAYPDGQSWNHVVATVDLAAYTGKKVQFAFVYKSTADAAPVWDVKDVKVTSEEGGQVTPPVAGEEVVVTKDAAYEESFASEFGKFTVEDKELGGLKFVWKIDTEHKYAKGSAFFGGAKQAESWLVSPVLNLNSLSKVALNFSQASYSAGQKDEFMVKVKNVTDNVDWSNVDFEMTTEQWKWIDNIVDLSAYAGKKIQLAFVYKNAKTDAANTWNVKNVKVSDGQGGGTVEPEPEPEPSEGYLIISEYVEGSANNKYIELYNPTSKAIDLSGYKLRLNANGKVSTDGELIWNTQNDHQLEGTLEAGKTIVYKHKEAALNLSEGVEAIESAAANFNGNDPIALFKGDVFN